MQTPESRVLLDCGIDVASSEKDAYPFLDAPEFNIKELDAVIISHAHLDHCGFVPYLFKFGFTKWVQPSGEDLFELKRPVDYFRMFYADTALYGDVAGLMCGYAFFGTDHMLFGTDYPWDIEGGDKYIRLTINAIDRMDISDTEKRKIFETNAKRLLRLDNLS